MHVIYVDDELPALDNFRMTTADFPEVDSLKLFQNGEEALEYVKHNTVEAAFLDMEMPGIHGLGLALKLKEICQNIQVIFVTAYSQYALDAWGVDATGYVLKPYSASDIRKELSKCRSRFLPSQKIVIETIPALSVTIDGQPLHLSGEKTRELLALLVDRGTQGVTAGEGISCLWPTRPGDANAQSLFRMTYKRLSDALESVGAGHIIVSKDNRRFLCVEQVDCDLYRILSGDTQAARKYAGQYLREYAWAEERNAQLSQMLMTE